MRTPCLLQAGHASVSLTAGWPQHMAGFAARDMPAAGVDAGLEMQCLRLSSAPGAPPLVLLAGDFLYWTRELRERIEVALDVSPQRLFLFASHTHCAPATDGGKPRLGPVSPAFMDSLGEQAVALVRRVAALAPRPVCLAWRTVPMAHAVNRRRMGYALAPGGRGVRRVVRMAPNPRATRGDEAWVIRARDETGAVAALLWSYACHPSAYPRREFVHPDYVGVVRDALREYVGQDLAALFLLGPAGDRRADTRAARNAHGLRAWRSRWRFNRFDLPQWRAWSGSIAQRVVEALTDDDGWRDLTPRLESHDAYVPLSRLLAGATGGIGMRVGLVRLAEEFDLFTFGAEVVHDYEKQLRTWCPAVRSGAEIRVAGCEGAVFGYLPTSRMLREGGYEAERFLPYFNLEHPFTGNPESAVRDIVVDLCAAAGTQG